MCGCGDDTVGGTSGEAMTTDSGASDAPVDSTTTTPDTGAKPDTGTTVSDATVDSSSETADTGTDTGTTVLDSSTPDTGVVDSSRHDTGAKDFSVADVAVNDATADASDAGTASDAGDGGDGGDGGQTLCDIFNAEYLVNGQVDIDEDGNSWLVEVINGPGSGNLADGGCNQCGNPGSIGLTYATCAPGSVMTDLTDYTSYQNNVVLFEKRVFGCYDAQPYDSSLGIGYAFAIIPMEYTGPLTKGDLDDAVAFYVQQAILVFDNHGVTITQDQLTEMTTLLQASESGYPNISTTTNAPTTPICTELDGGLQ